MRKSKEKLNKIKILATLGPSSMKRSIVQKMDSSGVDVFRINLSHTKIEHLPTIIEDIRNWTKKPICLDTEGAQIRTGKIKNGAVILENNQIVSLVRAEKLGDKSRIPLYPIVPSQALQLGDILYLDFQSVIAQVIKMQGERVLARILSGGKIGSNKAVSLDRLINLPALTAKDKKALDMAKKMNLGYFALSFAAKPQDIKKLRQFFPYPIFVISKIESRAGLINLKNICQLSDAILIDRGDLSREIPLQKIGFIQRDILNIAKEMETPVYVATNLLESMLNNFSPSRAEINDISSTLLSGAKGLVLAAETAIGKHAVESVRMTSGIIKEAENYIVQRKDNQRSRKFLSTIYGHNLIEPHGGTLIQNFTEPKEAKSIETLPAINLDEEIMADIVQIAEGTYSPLQGFMNYEELMSVLENYKLPEGPVWTLPVLLQRQKKDIQFSKKDTIALRRDKDKIIYGLMEVAGIEQINLSRVAKKWFGTANSQHPGVADFLRRGDYIVSGKVFLFRKPCLGAHSYSLTPRQTRQIFQDRGWQKIIGFHTRNPVHAGHEFIQKKALEIVNADALFISPVVGAKKKGDFTPKAILKGYEIMLKTNSYSPYQVLISTFNTYARYSGPREAVFTALCRKNFGCSHFIVGRDHTGVGNYYPSDASQKLFNRVGDIGIKPVMFEAVYFCKICKKTTTNCPHQQGEELSGTEVRRHLINNLKIPEYLMKEKISKVLEQKFRASQGEVLEGFGH